MKKIVFVIIAVILIIIAVSTNVVDKNTPYITQEDVEVDENETGLEPEPKEDVKLTEDEYRELGVNELGDIPVVMYHGIVKKDPPSVYQITVEQFKSDLEYFYDNKYIPISMKEYVTGNIDVKAGYTPVVFTFDDGLGLGKESTLGVEFALEEKDGELLPVENSAVAIMNEFAKEHPEFGKAATFFINGGEYQFNGAGTLRERFEYLIENGYELGNHTKTHAHLYKLDKNEILEELGSVDKMIKENTDGFTPISITYPFGERPKKEFRQDFLEGSYEGEEYEYQVAFREGPSMPFVPSTHIRFDKLNAPRLRGNKGDKDKADLWGQLERYEKNPTLKYISDGDPNTVVIPKSKEKYINLDAMNDKNLVIYEKTVENIE